MVDTRFFHSTGPLALSELIAGVLDLPAEQAALASEAISDAAEPALAGSGAIALVAAKDYVADIKAGSGAIIISNAKCADLLPDRERVLVAEDAHAAFATLLDRLFPNPAHALALALASGAHRPLTEENVTISASATIGPDVEIGRGTIIGPGAVIGKGVTIGRNSIVGPNASIECAHIGDHVILHAGVRVGTEGFGWLDHARTNRKVPQLGRVIVQDRVEVGANSTIDRGALGDTVIGEGTKIDNLVQIGHNCRIGRHCLIAATSGISGSTIVGDGVLMGGGVGTSGHLTIGQGSVVYGRAAVTKDWPAGSKLAGAPAQDIKDFWRELAQLRRLGKGDKGES